MERHNFWELLQNYRIKFPLIQRDYAQGRMDSISSEVRRRFIASLLQAVRERESGKPLVLGFIFGKSEGDCFIPFDGQQRLCTLFLLHLYAALKDGAFKEHMVGELFHKLGYEAREDLGNFIARLLEFFASASEDEIQGLIATATTGPQIANHVKKQPWFSPAWHRDQSICGFLVTLDEIRQAFADYGGLWNALVNGQEAPVQFYFADIEDFDASAEDLFIKMNSRGKGLGHFEKFKAAFLEWLKWEEPENAERIARKLDTEWQDLFWSAFGKNHEGDKTLFTEVCFYNFLKWFAGILFHTSKGTENSAHPRSELPDLMIDALQREQQLQAPDSNISFLENVLDSLALLEKQHGVSRYLGTIFWQAGEKTMPQPGRISLYHNVDMFREICLKGTIEGSGSLMFFACLIQLVNNYKNMDSVQRDRPSQLAASEEQIRKLRVLRNLLENSREEISTTSMYCQLEGISRLLKNEDLRGNHAFNNFQLAEEKAKIDARKEDPFLWEDLEWLEDHPLLRGCTAIFSRQNSRRNKLQFSAQELQTGRRLFERALGKNPLAWDKLLQGLLAQNIFGLREGSLANKYFYLGKDDNESRRRIFTTSRADCFSEIRDAVQKLGEKIGEDDGFSMESVIGKIIYKWIEKCRVEGRLDWRWYFVAYPEILPSFSQTDGYYDWDYSWRSFEQRQLRKQIMKGPHKNPFLWAVYVEAGFCDSDKNKGRALFQEKSGRGKDNPIAFPKSRLGLWGGELFWHISSMNGRVPGKKQMAFLEQLRQSLAGKGIKINSEGYCLIPGKDSRRWDYKNFSPEKTADVIRKYDSQDRVEMGKTIALEMWRQG